MCLKKEIDYHQNHKICCVNLLCNNILYFALFAIDFFCRFGYNSLRQFAGVMELADVLDSKSSGSDTVRVRPPLPAPVIIQKAHPARPDPWIVAVGVGFLRVCRITVPRSDTGRGDRRYRADACGQRQRVPRRYATRTAAPGLLPGAGASR